MPIKKYHIYFWQDNEEIKFNNEFYEGEEADWYVNQFNSLYHPVKFFKKEAK